MTINYDIELKNVKIKFAQMDVNLGNTLSQVVRSIYRPSVPKLHKDLQKRDDSDKISSTKIIQ